MSGKLIVVIWSYSGAEVSINLEVTGEVKNGLFAGNDGEIYYYVNGGIATSYTGSAKNSYGIWYMKKRCT